MAGEEVRVRRMTAADLDRVLEISAGLTDAPHWKRAAYETAIESGSAVRRTALVADVGLVAGFAVASVVEQQAELESIAVEGEFQRRGMARRLLAALMEELSAEGVKDVLLEVRASNGAAIGLYGTLGFEETGRRVGYYADPQEDAVLMGFSLRP